MNIEDGHLDGYYYLATDHLGNVRHVDKVAPDNRGHEIVQVNNYYPYGSMHADGKRGQDKKYKLTNTMVRSSILCMDTHLLEIDNL